MRRLHGICWKHRPERVPPQGLERGRAQYHRNVMYLKYLSVLIVLNFPKLGSILPKLGMIMESLSLSNALFSKVQQRVLALIFGQPERSFYASEIMRNVRSGTGAVERELSRLQRSGLVSVERIGNQKHYRANRESA